MAQVTITKENKGTKFDILYNPITDRKTVTYINKLVRVYSVNNIIHIDTDDDDTESDVRYFYEDAVDKLGTTNINDYIQELFNQGYLYNKPAGGISGSGGTATATTYDNAISGLSASDVQEAIDELSVKPTAQNISTDRNLLSTDVGNLIVCSVSSVLTIPLDFTDMIVGTHIPLQFLGTTLTVTAAAGVTLNGNVAGSEPVGNDSYSGTVLYKISSNSYAINK